jgi:hypothetical protein
MMEIKQNFTCPQSKRSGRSDLLQTFLCTLYITTKARIGAKSFQLVKHTHTLIGLAKHVHTHS